MTETPKPESEGPHAGYTARGSCHAAPTQRDVVGTSPDWLTAQTRALSTAKPSKPKAAYRRRWK